MILIATEDHYSEKSTSTAFVHEVSDSEKCTSRPKGTKDERMTMPPVALAVNFHHNHPYS
jgi:hypothetical protein